MDLGELYELRSFRYEEDVFFEDEEVSLDGLQVCLDAGVAIATLETAGSDDLVLR